jgi:hypothetical protein
MNQKMNYQFNNEKKKLYWQFLKNLDSREFKGQTLSVYNIK